MSRSALKKRPTAGSTTARLWEIADEIRCKTGEIPTGREVVDAYVAEGGNEGTGFTQYSHWKKSQLNRSDEADSEAQGAGLRPIRLVVASDGRVLIPADLRAAMHLDRTGYVTATVENGELRLVSPKTAIRHAQELLAPLKMQNESVVDGFLAERRALWGEE